MSIEHSVETYLWFSPQKLINYDIAAELLHRGTYKTVDVKPGLSPDEVGLLGEASLLWNKLNSYMIYPPCWQPWMSKSLVLRKYLIQEQKEMSWFCNVSIKCTQSQLKWWRVHLVCLLLHWSLIFVDNSLNLNLRKLTLINDRNKLDWQKKGKPTKVLNSCFERELH